MQDHWVADVTREEILRTRADGIVREIISLPMERILMRCRSGALKWMRMGSKRPGRGESNDSNPGDRWLEHAWCLNQSEFVHGGGKWLEELLDEDEDEDK